MTKEMVELSANLLHFLQYTLYLMSQFICILNSSRTY